MAFFENFNTKINNGVTNGILITAINEALFPALAAIAETNVNVEEKPIEARTKQTKNCCKEAISLLIIIL